MMALAGLTLAMRLAENAWLVLPGLAGGRLGRRAADPRCIAGDVRLGMGRGGSCCGGRKASGARANGRVEQEHMMTEAKRPIAVVTGGTAGIGRATVREFARNGYDVAVLARGKDGLDATKREIEDLGGRALAIPTDVSDWKAVEAAADRIERELGPIDVWVNNAFAGIFARFMDVTPEEYERVTVVTYLGQVNGTRAALKRMLPRNRGKVVLVGSALAYRGIPLQSAYCGAKHAIQGFIDSVRCELLHDKTDVTITMVQMPGVNTPQFDWIRAKMPGQPRPVGKVYQPEVAARAIFAAAHDDAQGDAGRAADGRGGVGQQGRLEPARRLSRGDRVQEPAAARAGQPRPQGQSVRAGRRRPRRARQLRRRGGRFERRAVGQRAQEASSGLPRSAPRRRPASASCSPRRSGEAAASGPDQRKRASGARALLAPKPSRAVAPAAGRGRRVRRRGGGGDRLAAAAGMAAVGRTATCARPQALGAGAAILCAQRRARQRDRTLPRQLQEPRDVRRADAWRCSASPRRRGSRSGRRDADEPLPTIALRHCRPDRRGGLGFHTYNILKRPGRVRARSTCSTRAPVGAPAALTLAGLYGVIAGEMLSGRDYVRTRLPRHTAALVAFSLLGTVAEAGLLHFRGAFQDPVMYAPVTIPPLAAVAIGASRAVAARDRRRPSRCSRRRRCSASPVRCSTPTESTATWAAGATGAR